MFRRIAWLYRSSDPCIWFAALHSLRIGWVDVIRRERLRHSQICPSRLLDGVWTHLREVSHSRLKISYVHSLEEFPRLNCPWILWNTFRSIAWVCDAGSRYQDENHRLGCMSSRYFSFVKISFRIHLRINEIPHKISVLVIIGQRINPAAQTYSKKPSDSCISLHSL